MFNIEKKNMIIYFEYAKLCALRAYLLYVPLLLSLLLSFFLSYLTCLVPDMAEVRHALRDLVSYVLVLYLMWPLCLVPYMFHVLLSSLILLCSLVSKCFFSIRVVLASIFWEIATVETNIGCIYICLNNFQKNYPDTNPDSKCFMIYLTKFLTEVIAS